WPDRHGIGGNTLPLPGASILDSDDGFDSTRLLAEPIWVTASRQGLAVTVPRATQAWPFTPYRRGGRFGGGVGDLTMLDSFGSIWDGARVYTGADLTLTEAGAWLGPVPSH